MNKTLLILLVCLTNLAYSQTSNQFEYYSHNNIIINIALENCIDAKKGIEKQYNFIEIINNNSSPVKVSFKKDIWYNNVCQSCNSNSEEYKVNLVIPANSSVNGDCDSENKSLRIFSKMLNLNKVRKLSKYELKNINVEIIK